MNSKALKGRNNEIDCLNLWSYESCFVHTECRLSRAFSASFIQLSLAPGRCPSLVYASLSGLRVRCIVDLLQFQKFPSWFDEIEKEISPQRRKDRKGKNRMLRSFRARILFLSFFQGRCPPAIELHPLAVTSLIGPRFLLYAGR
jgi:hypothetical protein